MRSILIAAACAMACTSNKLIIQDDTCFDNHYEITKKCNRSKHKSKTAHKRKAEKKARKIMRRGK